MRRSRTLLSRLLFIALWIMGAGLFVAGVGALAMYAAWFPDWVGFGADALPAGSAAAPVVIYEQKKTLWDWLQLLLVPGVLALGGFWLTRTENRYAQKLQDQREQETRNIEAQRAQEAVLQAYLDHMTELLLTHDLGKPEADEKVRSVSRARTLTALRVLDASRKGTVMQFLHEAGLIQGMRNDLPVTPIVALNGAYLESAHLDRANLVGAHLEEVYLAGAHLREANLLYVLLSGAHMEEAHLTRANLIKAHLEETHLERADLGESNLTWSHLRGAHLQEANLIGAYALYANFVGARLDGANLDGANLEESNLTGAHLEKAHLPWALLRSACLERALLVEANLAGANMEGVNLTEANLIGANLASANLAKANLEGANLAGAYLTGANLAEANLEGANLEHAYLKGTNLEEAIITSAKNIDLAILDDAQRKLLGLPPKLPPKLQPPDTSKGNDEAGG